MTRGFDAVLDLAREQAQLRWPALGGLRRVLRLKFVRPLRPGEHLRMSLIRDGRRVQFCLATDDSDKIGVGTLEFA